MRYPKWPLYLVIIIAALVGLLIVTVMVAPKSKIITNGPLKMEVPLGMGDETEGKPLRINTWVSATATLPAEAVKVFYHSSTMILGEMRSQVMVPAGETGLYTTTLPPLKMRQSYDYYLQAADGAGHTVTYPEGAPGTWEEDKLATVDYKRDMWPWLSSVHFILMVTALLIFLHAGYYALLYLASHGAVGIGKTLSASFWAAIVWFIFNFPVGCLLAYAFYDTPWTGFPIIWKLDKPDNKGFISFVFFLIILLLMKGSIFHKDETKNAISGKAFAWLVLIGVFIVYFFTFTGRHI